MLYEYLLRNYEVNIPIFVSDINLSVSDVNLRQMFKVLCDSGKIKRFDKGIYYLPKQSKLKGGISPTVDSVIKYKYIGNNNIINGYYSGYTFANQLGITTQVPYVKEIVSNNTSAIVREIALNNQRIVLRKAKVKINKNNYKVLQLLDLLKDIEQYADCGYQEAASIIKKYINDNKIKKIDVDKYLNRYPDKTYKALYKMKIYEVLA